MSSIRPLVTITIIFAVGVFMFKKINEDPASLPPGTETSFDSAPLAEVPSLSTTDKAAPAPTWSGNSTGTGELTPQWTGDATQGVATASPLTPPTSLPTTPEESTVAAAPPIPELPPLSPPPESTVAITPIAPATMPIPLPSNIPTAQYPGETGANSVAVAPLTTTPQIAAPAPVPSTTIAENVSPAPPTATQLSSPKSGAVPSVSPDVDRYAVSTIPAAPVVATPSIAAPSELTAPSFASTWPQIQGALERQELVAAHEMLSQWYGNPNLSPAEKEQVELLLGQLAGTVVYSTEHRLEPPYTVHAGDTLQTIAQQYEVPWQLLAKINGIPAANMVQPGQQLKVVHGPFSAVVELDESQLTLLLDGRYAGRFPITVEPSAPLSEGQWVLEQKLVNPTTEASGVVSASFAPSAVDRVLVLRNESPTAGGATISITGGQSSPSGPTVVAPAAIRLSARDAEEVADILSEGSSILIRR